MHPLGFRLGITRNYHPSWFARPKVYPEYIAEDIKVRDCPGAYARSRRMRDNSPGVDGIGRVSIRRKTDLPLVEVHTESPAVLIKSHNLGIEKLRLSVQKAVSGRIDKVHVTMAGMAKPYGEPDVLAKYMALQLGNRVAFRRTVKKTIELAGKCGRKGIKIQISGRLNGAEIARTEWAREGRVPLHTLRAPIDYYYYPAKTVYGVLGIKIWILREKSKRG
uniref:Small ribosomal subunit protein uS3c n=1 Tax=Megaloselaginella exaltata TaxID=3140882 RepID=A0A7T8G019_9TRAC|nr:ribosomal protein S3 [Selaginella exaltata]